MLKVKVTRKLAREITNEINRHIDYIDGLGDNLVEGFEIEVANKSTKEFTSNAILHLKTKPIKINENESH